MATQQIRNAVWQEYLDAARLSRYCDALANRYARLHNFFRLLMCLPLLVGISFLLDLLPNIVEIAIGAVVVIAVVIDAIFNIGEKAYVLSRASRECNKLEDDYKILWLSMETDKLVDKEILEEISQLTKKLEEIAVETDAVGITTDKNLNIKCAAEAYRNLEKRYEYSHRT